MRKTYLFFAAVLLSLLGGSALLHFLSQNLGESSAGGTLQSGRSVSATSDSWYLVCNNSPDTATIKTAGKTIVVAPSKVLVDGHAIAPLDVAVRSVEVKVKRGKVVLVADGNPVTTVTR
jgi:hypothetical protein